MDEELIKIGMPIELEYGEGIVIHKTIKDGRLYINVAFGEGLEDASFRIYSVDFDEEGATFNEVVDEQLSTSLSAKWLTRDLYDLDQKKNGSEDYIEE